MKERRLTGLESLNEIWNDLFLNAIYSGNIYVKGNNFHIEYNGTDNIINSNQFKMAFKETFDKVYRENIYPVFTLKSLSSEQVITVCAWLNPALGDLKIDGYEEYKKRLKDRYTIGGKNYDESDTKLFKMQLRSTLFGLNEAQRKKYIEYLMPYEILGLNDLIDLEYYTDIPKNEVLEEYRDENGKFPDEVLQSLTELSMGKITELEKSKHRVSSNKIKRYTQFIPADFLITMAERQQIPYSYLEHSSITKKDIFSMRYEAIVSALHNMDKYPERLRITSQDILNEYGKTINGSRLYKFVMYGFVDSKQVIDIIRLNKVLRVAGESEENLYDDEEVLSYYSSTRLAEMFFEGEIDVDFIEKYKSALNSPEVFEKKSEYSIEQIKQNIMFSDNIPSEERDEKCQQSVLEAYNLGLCTPRVLKENITPSYLEKLYLRGDISDVDILNFYRVGVVDKKLIKEYFSDEEIFELYLQGNLDRDIVSIMEDEQERDEKILEAVMDEKMPIIDVVYLYLNGSVNIDLLEDTVEFSEQEIDFVACIDENVDFSKIKEMFERKIIDYNCVTNLKDIGIITEEQLEELKETMDKERFFDGLKGKTFKLVTSRKQEGRVLGHRTDEIKEKPQEDKDERYLKEKELISKILGIDDVKGNIEAFATIESYNQSGRPTSLNGYSIFGSRDNGLVVFAKFQKNNAVFIMPFYQAAYFLNSRRQENSADVIIKDRMQDKAYLKTINQVEVVPHTEYFARNLSLAACRLSPDFAEKFNGDKRYQSEIQALCQDMRLDYRIERGLEEL